MSRSKLLCAVMTVLTLLFLMIPAFAQEENVTGKKEKLLNMPTELICVSKYGDRVNYPENSAQGVAAAVEQGADMVMVYVRKTADGVPVLFSDETLERMCVDAANQPADKKLAELTYDELSEYRLRNGDGNTHNPVTAYTVSKLSDALEAVRDRAMLLIDCDWSLREDIYNVLISRSALDDAVILANAKKGEVSSWLASKNGTVNVFSKYKGTVIWSSESYIKKTAQAGACGVMLASGNPYSTTFSETVVSKTDGVTRAVIDMTDKKLCGKRDDTAVYWDDVTSRGFSVIITDNVEQFVLYRQRVDTARQELLSLIDTAEQTDTAECSSYSSNKLNTALRKAKTAAEKSVSAMDLDSAKLELSAALDGLSDKSSKNNRGLDVSAGKIVAAAAAIIAFVLAELYIERIRNKRISLRRRGIDKKGRYKLSDKEKDVESK